MAGPPASVLVVRLDAFGDVLLAGPAVRAVAASGARVTLLCGPGGRPAADLLPGVEEVIAWDAPWIAASPGPVEPGDVAEVVDRVRKVGATDAVVLTSYHQSALPTALLLRLAGVPRITAISEDYPGSLLDVRHHVPELIPEPERALSVASAAGYELPPGDDGRLRVRGPLPPAATLAADLGESPGRPVSPAPPPPPHAPLGGLPAEPLLPLTEAPPPPAASPAGATPAGEGGGDRAVPPPPAASPVGGGRGRAVPDVAGGTASLADRLAPGFVVVHPGTSVPARAWPAERFAAAVRALAGGGHRVVVTGTAAERGLTGRVAGDTGLDLGGRTDARQLASLLGDAAVLVAGNTGPAHLAAAVGTPVVSLFAPTVPAVKWAPYGVPRVILGDQDAPCRDTRARECPVPGHPCLTSVTPEEVVAAVQRLAAG